MNRARVILINGLLAFVIGVHVYENAVDGEHWPFCSYPMYSQLETERAITLFRVVGVRHDGSETAIHRNEFLHPFDQSRLNEGLQIAHFEQSSGELALNDVLARYEKRRQVGEHDGPAIKRARLYRMKHRLEPWAGNLHSPHERQLLAESDPIE